MRRIPVSAGRLVLSTRYPEELEVALSEGRLVRKSEDRISATGSAGLDIPAGTELGQSLTSINK